MRLKTVRVPQENDGTEAEEIYAIVGPPEWVDFGTPVARLERDVAMSPRDHLRAARFATFLHSLWTRRARAGACAVVLVVGSVLAYWWTRPLGMAHPQAQSASLAPIQPKADADLPLAPPSREGGAQLPVLPPAAIAVAPEAFSTPVPPALATLPAVSQPPAVPALLRPPVAPSTKPDRQPEAAAVVLDAARSSPPTAPAVSASQPRTAQAAAIVPKVVGPARELSPVAQSVAPSSAPAQELPGSVAKVTVVDIDRGGAFALITNPQTRLPEKVVVGQKIFTGETVRKIDAAAGKIALDARTVSMQ